MRLDQFDLNLLIAFDVLLRERNVTKAANSLHMTQSAMSAALKRLRESFGDDILVQHGKKMIPTARAAALAPDISAAIQSLRNLITSGTGFDPAVSARRFRIAASDYIATVLIVPLLPDLQQAAPRIEFELLLPDSNSGRAMDNGELDLMLTPEQYTAKDHPSDLLFSERHVVIGCASNPVFQSPLTVESFESCGHVALEIHRSPTFVEMAIKAAGDRRRIELVASSFLQVPWMLRGTNRLALIPERLAMVLAAPLSLAIADCPIKLPAMNEMMQYHSARAGDPGLLWLRERLMAAAGLNR
ncbi:MAG: LysR family transcriptional regulator [Sphingomonadales bacterium]|nr:LysR family transcriptional regulator [Sphingomonadales bacterium]MDE2170621.1 LysR family transcriptional regulator [Sphingomonadales bacterium]